jgi:hypothetical protein
MNVSTFSAMQRTIAASKTAGALEVGEEMLSTTAMLTCTVSSYARCREPNVECLNMIHDGDPGCAEGKELADELLQSPAGRRKMS